MGKVIENTQENIVDMYDIKEQLIENIKLLPMKDLDELRYIYRLYGITECYLKDKGIH